MVEYGICYHSFGAHLLSVFYEFQPLVELVLENHNILFKIHENFKTIPFIVVLFVDFSCLISLNSV